MLPEITVAPILASATQSILGDQMPTYSLAIWHGINLPLLMSTMALIGGIGLYFFLQWRQASGMLLIYRFDGKQAFEWFMLNASALCAWLIARFSSTHLQAQLLLVVCAAFGAVLLPLQSSGIPWGSLSASDIDVAFALLWLVGGACAVMAAYKAKFHRLVALIFAGVAGLATCLTFAWFSAPDLALTQAVVEVVTTLLILLGLRWLPQRIEPQERGQFLPVGLVARLRRSRDFLIAMTAGTGMAILSYVMLTRPIPEGISPFFVREALTLGGGLNVVNVILVDFRGFDTFGEITVLGIVALTVYALLRRFRPAAESVAPPYQQLEQEKPDSPDAKRLLPSGYLMLPTVLVRLMLPIAVLMSIYFMLRGHNAPGGGFVGGLILTTAFILQYIVSGVVWVETRTRILPQYWISCGLLLAGLTGTGAWFAAKPFLSALSWHGSVPLIGEVHLSSVLLFDLGVYMLVVGATTLILVALAHQSLRSEHAQHRKNAQKISIKQTKAERAI